MQMRMIRNHIYNGREIDLTQIIFTNKNRSKTGVDISLWGRTPHGRAGN